MATPPSTFTRQVSNGSETVSVDFKLHPIRSSNFQVLVQAGNASFNTHTPPPPRTYLGTVRDHPGALASGLLKENGTLLCRISFQSGVEWSSTGGTATVRGNTNWTPAWPTTGVVPAGGAGSIVYAAEVGVDATYRQFIAANSNLNDTVEMAEYSVMAANVVYLRDAAILHQIGKIIVRANEPSDPYVAAGGDTNALLLEVRNQWNNVLPVGTTHNLALVVRPGANGGLAWVGVIGTESRYSSNGADSNGDFSVIWRHEAGHNWGSNHYEGGGQPEGPTIMSDNALSRFSSSELLKILAHRNTKTNILKNLGAYSFEIPPRANMVTGKFAPGNAITLDLLSNDSDSNGQAITLKSFPSKSALGGTITKASSLGSVLYTPPAGVASGTDHFAYEIADAASKTATGFAVIKTIFDEQLVAHWPFDDERGSRAQETTSSQNHGQVIGNGYAWVAGHIRGAIELHGNETHVEVAELNVNTNTITTAGWVRRDGNQPGWAALTMCRGNGTVAGFNLGPSNDLRYHWDAGSNPSYNFSSGLILPDGTWTFCALVISPTQATIYMKPVGSSQIIQSATATGTFLPQSFQANFYLGYDPSASTRHFKGALDDFRIFQRALSIAEIMSLANGGGTPSTPLPPVNGTTLASRRFDFSWKRAPSLTSFNVYLSMSYNLVRDAATTNSPAYIGSTSNETLGSPNTLSEGAWFWRVDASDGTTTMKGPVWHFNVVADIPGIVSWWKMDEGIGNTIWDSSGSGANGVIVKDATWGSGKYDGGLILNGSGGVSCGTRASLQGTVAFSVSAWVKLPTILGGRMVIIQQRGPTGYNGEYMLRVAADGKPNFTVFGDGAYQFDFVATKAINDNQWHHIVAVRNGTQGSIYIDSVVSGSASGTVRNLDATIPVFIGYDSRDNVDFFNGSLDEVRIYNRAISGQEVSTLLKRTLRMATTQDIEPMICKVP